MTAPAPKLEDTSIAILRSIRRSEFPETEEKFDHRNIKEISAAFGMKNHETAKKLQQLWQDGHLTAEGAPYSEDATLKLHQCRLTGLGLRTISERQ